MSPDTTDARLAAAIHQALDDQEPATVIHLSLRGDAAPPQPTPRVTRAADLLARGLVWWCGSASAAEGVINGVFDLLRGGAR